MMPNEKGKQSEGGFFFPNIKKELLRKVRQEKQLRITSLEGRGWIR